MKFKIRFEPQTGKKNTPLGDVEVKFDQMKIFASREDDPETESDEQVKEVLVGYIGTQGNAPINLIVNWGDDVNALLRESIVEAAKSDESLSASSVHQIPGENEDEEPEDEDDENEDLDEEDKEELQADLESETSK